MVFPINKCASSSLFLLCFFWPDCRARPRYLLLDESTSALDAANEAMLYGQLAALGITPISVSHHHAIASFHHQTLELHGDGGWGLKRAGGTQSAGAGQ